MGRLVVQYKWSHIIYHSFIAILSWRDIIISSLLQFSRLEFLFLFLIYLRNFLLFFYLLSPCYLLSPLDLLLSERRKLLLLVVLVLPIFSSLILRHLYIINLYNPIRFIKQKYKSMSKSTRQISNKKPLPPGNESVPLILIAQKRNRSVENKNFCNSFEKGKQLYYSNKMSQAIEYLQRGLYYDHNHLQLNFMLGVAHLTLNQYQKALKYLIKVGQLSPKYKNNIFMLTSIAHKKLNNIKDSLTAINRQIQLQDDIQSLFYRAKIYYKQKKYSKALDDIDNILIKNSRHSSGILLKIKVLLVQGKNEECMDFIVYGKEMVQEIQKLQEIKLEEVKLKMTTGLYEESLLLLQRIQKEFIIVNEHFDLLKGKVYQKTNRSQEAIILYNEILAKYTNPKIICEAISEISIYYMKQRDFYQALAYLKRTYLLKIKSKPTDNLLKLAEGLTFLMKKKYTQAIMLIGSCQLQFQNSLKDQSIYLWNLYYNSLAFGNFCLGNHGNSMDLYRKINKHQESTQYNSISYNIFICQGILNYQKNKKSQAIELFEKAYTCVMRPQPYFYMAVILNEDYLSESINTDGFIRILQLVEKGLAAGQSAHMYYYRAIIYLFLGMNAESLEDIDRAIEKSQDNVSKYFHARGVIFMIDHNYQQAIMEFGTSLSIDQSSQDSSIEKAKCELLNGDPQSAFSTIQGLQRQEEYKILFNYYQKNYLTVMDSQYDNETVIQTCNMMMGKFQSAGASGKLIMAILYQNYEEVIKLIDQALNMNIFIGCLDLNDLLFLKSFCEYRTSCYQESIVSLIKIEKMLKENSSKSDNICQDEQKKLLICKLNIILINFKRGHKIESIEGIQELLEEVCQGPIMQELNHFKRFLIDGNQYQIGFALESNLISDYFLQEQHQGLKFKFLIPMPNPKIPQVQNPQYQKLLTEFKLKDIQNKPEAPWIKRGKYGVIFTNEIHQFQNLNLKTQENQGPKLKVSHTNSNYFQNKSRIKKQLQLSKSVIQKLQKIANKFQKT